MYIFVYVIHMKERNEPARKNNSECTVSKALLSQKKIAIFN
jgi:hypothetical protein